MRHRIIENGLSGLVLLIVMLLPSGAVAAQGGGEFELPPGVTWDQVNAIARRMYCDVCEGIPLDECESITCRQWREEIARQLGEGRTADEILDYFVERYGADVAALPRSTTDRLIAFAVPIAIVVLLGLLGALQMQRLRQRGQQAGAMRRSTGPLTARPVPDDLEPEMLARLERELEALES